MYLQCGKFRLSLSRPLIMGVLNVTPDSFSDGGKYIELKQALDHARALIAEGADLLDIGGESTRPGALPVSLDEERRRVLPVLDGLADSAIPISVDTQKPQLMREAVAAGASMINDVCGFRADGAFDAVANSDAAICIMHMQGEPRSMQQAPHYEDVIGEVRDYLAGRADAAQHAGIAIHRIVIDPGFGFGKTMQHNLEMVRDLRKFRDIGGALLVGISRKAMLGKMTGRDPLQRTHASTAAALIAVQNGAQIVRVHDVAATRDALAVLAAVQLE